MLAYEREPSPKCRPRLAQATYGNTSVTPGILRPEEQQNSMGRCHHQDSRFHGAIDTTFLSDRRFSRDVDDLDRAATLPYSTSLRHSKDDQTGYCGRNRESTSSTSSYSTQGGDRDSPVSTNRLLRYYTGDSPEKKNDDRIRRTSHFSITTNPWDETQPHSKRLTAQDRPRLGSAPPPYQPGS